MPTTIYIEINIHLSTHIHLNPRSDWLVSVLTSKIFSIYFHVAGWILKKRMEGTVGIFGLIKAHRLSRTYHVSWVGGFLPSLEGMCMYGSDRVVGEGLSWVNSMLCTFQYKWTGWTEHWQAFRGRDFLFSESLPRGEDYGQCLQGACYAQGFGCIEAVSLTCALCRRGLPSLQTIPRVTFDLLLGLSGGKQV